MAHFLSREAHGAFIKELLGVVARDSWSGDEAADVCLRRVRSGSVTQYLVLTAHQDAEDDNTPVRVHPANLKPM
jgi:hypothetical protein